jgi:hypothetical protein
MHKHNERRLHYQECLELEAQYGQFIACESLENHAGWNLADDSTERTANSLPASVASTGIGSK